MVANVNKQFRKMYFAFFVCSCLIPYVLASVELSVVWDSNIGSYGLRKGKVDEYISMVRFEDDVNKTG